MRLGLLLPALLGIGAAGPSAPQGDADRAAASRPETDAERAERERAEELDRSQATDPSNVDTPIFPVVRYRDAFQLRVQTHFLPDGDFETYDADLYRTDFRARVTAPLPKRSVLQLTARGSLTHFTFRDSADPLGLGRPLQNLGTAALVLQGAHQVNDEGWWFVEGESWSLLANVYARSRWEGDAFADALTYGGSVALGYQNADWRVALGINLESPLTGSGVDVGFVGNLRWDPTDRLTVRNRGQGIQIEYDLMKDVHVFTAAYRTSDNHLLEGPGELTLRDRETLVGAGFEWRISRHFRINVEAGVAATHNIRVKPNGGAPLTSEDADPGAYADFRIEVRP